MNSRNRIIWGILEVIQGIQIIETNQGVHKRLFNQEVMMLTGAAVSYETIGGNGNSASIANKNLEWVIEDAFD
jgi:hypothetical protein